jgi:hypothetical protein
MYCPPVLFCSQWMDPSHKRRQCALLHKCRDAGCENVASLGRYGDVLHCTDHERRMLIGCCSVCQCRVTRWTKVVHDEGMALPALTAPALGSIYTDDSSTPCMSAVCDDCGARLRCKTCGANPAREYVVDLATRECRDCALPCGGNCGFESTVHVAARRRGFVTATASGQIRRPVPYLTSEGHIFRLARTSCASHNARACRSVWYSPSVMHGTGPPLLCYNVEPYNAFAQRWSVKLARWFPKLPRELRDAVLEFMDADVCARCESPVQVTLRQVLLHE